MARAETGEDGSEQDEGAAEHRRSRGTVAIGAGAPSSGSRRSRAIRARGARRSRRPVERGRARALVLGRHFFLILDGSGGLRRRIPQSVGPPGPAGSPGRGRGAAAAARTSGPPTVDGTPVRLLTQPIAGSDHVIRGLSAVRDRAEPAAQPGSGPVADRARRHAGRRARRDRGDAAGHPARADTDPAGIRHGAAIRGGGVARAAHADRGDPRLGGDPRP